MLWARMAYADPNITHHGACSCGLVSAELTLPDQAAPIPRVCDCDFCRKNSGVFISCEGGELTLRTTMPLRVVRQGSNQASLLLCPKCGILTGVVIVFGDEKIGAVTESMFTEGTFGDERAPISPKNLSPEEKLERWKTIWMPTRIELLSDLHS